MILKKGKGSNARICLLFGTAVAAPLCHVPPARAQLSEVARPAVGDNPAAARGDIDDAGKSAVIDDFGHDELVVTGTRIVRDGYDAPSPVTAASMEQLLQIAPTNVPDALNKLPQFLGSSNPRNNRQGSSHIPEHGNLINLRGVGANRTLILMDGVRVPPTTFLGAVDANVLPQLLIQRVDVVTAGASAVYGSDAVTGVVNFVIDNKFQGVKGIAQYGISERGDGANYRLGAAYGMKLGDRGHLLLSAEHFDTAELKGTARSSAQSLTYGVGSTGVGAPGSATNPLVPRDNIRLASLTEGGLVGSGPFAGTAFFEPGVYRTFNPGTPTGTAGFNVGGDGFAYPSDRTLTAPLTTSQGFARVSYELSDSVQFRAQGILSKVKTRYSTAGNGLGNDTTIFSGNAFLPAALQQQLSATNTASFVLRKAYVGEGLSETKEATTFQSYTAGLTGQFGKGLSWALNYNYGKSKHSPRSTNAFEARRFAAAVDSVDEGVFRGLAPNGNIVCRVSLTNPGLYPGCVPLNPFGNGASSQAARDYVSNAIPTYTAKISQHTLSGSVQGDLFEGWAGPVSFSVGGEYRKQRLSLTSNSDPAVILPITGLRGIASTAGRFLSTFNYGVAEGESTVKEAFGEIIAPIASDFLIFDKIEVSGAARYTHYSNSGGVTTWKLGGTAQIKDLILRGTLSRDIRAPTLYDLFAGSSTSLTSTFDPHTNTTGPIQTFSGGNSALEPEKGKTLTFGAVFRPSFIPGFGLSLDYYKLDISKAITLLPAAQIAILCEQSNGTSPICDLITRPLPYSDRSPANRFTTIRQVNINAAFLNTEGLDFDASYAHDLGGGRLTARLFANYIFKFTKQNTDLSPIVEYAGKAGISPITREIRAEGIPRLRATLSMTYESGPFGIAIQQYMIGRVKYGDATQIWVDSVKPVKEVFYTDLTLSAKIVEANNATFFLSINNLFDRNPPVVVGGTSSPRVNVNTLRNLYDIDGRRFTLGVRMGF